MTAEQALRSGYCIVSRSFRRAARIDCADWKERLARSSVNGMDFVESLGPVAADMYRRQFSRDKIDVPEAWVKVLPNSNNGPREFLPLSIDREVRV